jgi:hypothetical protein
LSAATLVTQDPPLGTRHPWWRGVIEAVTVFIVYQGFEWLRAQVRGSASAGFRNAKSIVRIERDFGIYQERRVQGWLLGHTRALQFWDIYYGTVHFVAPALAMMWLWHAAPPERYRMWRNAFFLMSLVALIGFALYPLMPPRLMPASYGFVDTAARVGGLGPLDSGSMKDIENLYAAMPSLHMGWSLYSAVAVFTIAKRTWVKAAIFAYPVATLFAITVTANHWLLDAVGGVVALAAGVGLSVVLTPRLGSV